MKKLLLVFFTFLTISLFASCGKQTIMVRCPFCGELNETDKKYCSSCDSSLVENEVHTSGINSNKDNRTPDPDNLFPPDDQQPHLGEFNKNATIQSTVLLDESNVKITATNLSYNNHSAELELTFENNSTKSLSFTSGSFLYNCNSVNGYMNDSSYLHCEVAAGKKAINTISFDYDELMPLGIYTISDIELGFYVNDDDKYVLYSGPRQIKTSAYDSYDYTQNHYQALINTTAAMTKFNYEVKYFSKSELYNTNGIKHISSTLITNDSGSPTLLLEFENTTSSIVSIKVSDISLNELLIEDSILKSNTLSPGKRKVVEIKLSSVLKKEYWEIFGLKEIGSVSLIIGQSDLNDKALADDTPISITIPTVKAEFDSTGKEIYNKNGLTVISKAIIDDPPEYSDDVQVLLMVKNNSGKTLTIFDVYNSLSVNGFMVDWYYLPYLKINDGENAILIIDLYASSLEKINITSASQITNVELSLNITYNYTSLDKPILKINY